jgi:hypothetical protein
VQRVTRVRGVFDYADDDDDDDDHDGDMTWADSTVY